MAKQQRDRAKEAYWREVLGRHASTGLSVREFCKRERLTESQFYAWRRTIGQRSEPEIASPAFVPVVVTKDAGQEPSVTLELPSGCVLRFSGSHTTEQLADLVVALQSRCER